VLHDQIKNALHQENLYIPPDFALLTKVKTTYYCHERRCEVVAHGIVVGIELLPPLTKKIGWWYKVLIYSIHKSSEEHNKMFSKLKIDTNDLEEVEVMDIHGKDLIRDKVRIDISGLVAKLVELRVKEYKYYVKSTKTKIEP
jgi:hypothetical protein